MASYTFAAEPEHAQAHVVDYTTDDAWRAVAAEAINPDFCNTLRRSGYAVSELTRGAAEALYASAHEVCLLYTSPSPRDGLLSRMPSSA